MFSMDIMLPSSSPNSSPLGHRSTTSSGQWQMYRPSHSSPLSPTTNSSSAQVRRKAQFKSQGRGRTTSTAAIGDDSSQQRFLRDRFKAQCLERAKENRAKAIRMGRGSVDGSGSSDGFDIDGDSAMGDEESDIFVDDIYKRVMMNEIRRKKHSERVSFEQEFGSSIDPNMYDDMAELEQELTGKVTYRHYQAYA
ncbi:hypothetical protein M422DRAFT_48254 [Sphaerobolus stellatus SS14]|uniref:Uncharacterized protein n=1 Tax=Sphaerobolus stellatus (strain SS14) TaxID=990650 RepID=A0A0C9VV57_SPHS4|nr:hypothetical protein M422DRAFT_48254 [Sphaerobolus stellatus SS14]